MTKAYEESRFDKTKMGSKTTVLKEKEAWQIED